MEQLQVVSFNGQLVTESREVAKMIGKNHADLLRDIRNYMKVLGESNYALADFFIESSYTDRQNKERPCYLLTKKGCEMVANKLTGGKGVLFTAAYVTQFNQMENQLQRPNNTKLLLKTALEHEEKIESIQSDVSYLKETMRIDGVQEFKIRKLANITVVQSLGGKKSPAYKTMSHKVFSRFWRDFKDHFMIPRYGELPKIQFDEAIEFIKAWQPDTSTRLEIQASNRKQSVKGVV